MAQNSINNSIVNAILTRTLASSGQWDSYSDGTDTFGYYNNAGTPEGSVTANTGSYCSDTSNGDLYIKTTDSANTGWKKLQSTAGETGQVVQYKFASTNNLITLTTVVPSDDTPPTTSETDLITSLSITPNSATNILWIQGMAWNINGSGNSVIGCLFTDGSTDAIGVSTSVGSTTVSPVAQIVTGGTSAITVSFRAGIRTAGTFYLNGDTSTMGHFYGAAGNCTLTVMEIQA